MRETRLGLFFLLGFLTAVAAPLAAQESCPCPPPPPPPPLWTGSLGLSYLATSGNSESESFGLTADWARMPTPWGLEIHALANRAESEGVTTADRLFGAVRGRRAFGDRFEGFLGGSYEADELAGLDSRFVGEIGGLWKAIVLPEHELSFDAGLTWTSENPVIGESVDFSGALAGLAYVWKPTATATFRERLLWFPNFEESDDWRVRSETSFDAAFATAWALRLSYLYTRDNLPAPGFEKDDAATSISVVWKR